MLKAITNPVNPLSFVSPAGNFRELLLIYNERTLHACICLPNIEGFPNRKLMNRLIDLFSLLWDYSSWMHSSTKHFENFQFRFSDSVLVNSTGLLSSRASVSWFVKPAPWILWRQPIFSLLPIFYLCEDWLLWSLVRLLRFSWLLWSHLIFGIYTHWNNVSVPLIPEMFALKQEYWYWLC